MALTEPSARRLRPVRLTDIPLEVRLKAANEIVRRLDSEEPKALLAAALAPSDKVYFVTPDAFDRVAA